jgi:hypothetical protein
MFPAADPTNRIKFQFDACASQMLDPIEVVPKGETRNQMEWARGCEYTADGAPASRTPSRPAMPNQRDFAAMDDGTCNFVFHGFLILYMFYQIVTTLYDFSSESTPEML